MHVATKKKSQKRNILWKVRRKWLPVAVRALALGGVCFLAGYISSGSNGAFTAGKTGYGSGQQEFIIDAAPASLIDGGRAVADEEGLEDRAGAGEQGSILLVNKKHSLPEDYSVSLTTLGNGYQVASVMYEDLCRMMEDGEEQEPGAAFLVASGYRSREKQERLMKEEIDKNMWYGMDYEEACEDALLTVAPSGYSEHETGLAVDIVAVTNQRLDETQEDTKENRWLQENCYRYGFILRYPEGKENITGFSYESWHFRYVGQEAAEEITEQGITLEEYLGEY